MDTAVDEIIRQNPEFTGINKADITGVLMDPKAKLFNTYTTGLKDWGTRKAYVAPVYAAAPTSARGEFNWDAPYQPPAPPPGNVVGNAADQQGDVNM